MGCTNSVLPERVLKIHSVNCVLSNKDLSCLFCTLAMYMNVHNDLDSHISRYFTEFKTITARDSKKFRRVSVGNLPLVEEIVQRTIFLYNFDIQEVNM